MLYAEFRRHLGKAGMTINDFAAYLGVRPASVSNYSKLGEVPRNYAIIAILLGETVDRGANAPELLGSFGVFPQTVSADGNVEQLDMFGPVQVAPTSAKKHIKRRSKNSDAVQSGDSTKKLNGGDQP